MFEENQEKATVTKNKVMDGISRKKTTSSKFSNVLR